MAEFICRLGTPTGEVVIRNYEADALNELRVRLEREGFRIFAITPKGQQSLLTRDFSSGKLNIDEFLIFNQQLSTMLRAGLPILQALGILVRRQKPGKFRTTLEDVESRVRSGTALSDAFALHESIFPRLYTASILAGERSGDLDNVLLRYVNYMKTLSELQRKLKKTLIYPAVLLSACIGLVVMMTTYVIPKFATIYESSEKKLPYITEVVVGVSNVVRSNLEWIVPFLIISSVALWIWRRTDSGKITIDIILLQIPVIGDLIRQNTTAQLCRSLATLLAGGINLVEGFEIASESVTNRALRKTTLTVLQQLRAGQGFTDSLQEIGWLPPLAIDMIGVGERSGSLGEMLDEVANFFDAEIDVKLTSLTTLIEPVILIIMGSVVMTILLAMYLPILNLIGERN
jgi:type IV pilus assembly protein PilC